MIDTERQEGVRARLLERAREDGTIAGAAVTGSAARDAQDRWSDVDLFFAVADGTPVREAAEEWTAFLEREFGVLHHFDLSAGPALYRVFLLRELLEVDLGFTPRSEFGPAGEGAFRVVFGEPGERRALPADPGHLTGLAWHHVLHARNSLERAAWWQAEHWISALRDHTLALACLRLGLPEAYAKGADRLPGEITGPLAETLVRDLDPAELRRALRAAARAFLRELRAGDPVLAATLEQPLLDLAGPPPDGERPAGPQVRADRRSAAVSPGGGSSGRLEAGGTDRPHPSSTAESR